jgi:hypothetical protein
VNEHVAESWPELQALLFPDSWNDELGVFRGTLAFRGGRADLHNKRFYA